MENNDIIDIWYRIKKDIITKYNISCFIKLEKGNTKEIEASSFTLKIEKNLILSCYNNNFIFVILGEVCCIIPKLCAIRWKYFEAIVQRYNGSPDHPSIIDLTQMLIDSQCLQDLSYSYFHRDFLRFIYESKSYYLYMRETDIKAWKKFLTLLIPPENYWDSISNESSYSSFNWYPSSYRNHLFVPEAEAPPAPDENTNDNISNYDNTD